MVGNKVAEKITKVVSKTTWEDPKELSAQTDETAQLIRIPIYIYIYIYIENGVSGNHKFAQQLKK